MLRLGRRADPLVRFAALGGVRQHALPSHSQSFLSTTPVAAGKSKSLARPARKGRRKNSRSRSNPAGQGWDGTSKSEEGHPGAPKSKKKKQASLHTSSDAQNNGVDGAPSAQGGAGIWTSLQARLQASAPRRVTEDDADRYGDEHVKSGDHEEALDPSDSAADEETSSKRGTTVKSKRAISMAALDVKTITPRRLCLYPVEEDTTLPVPKLSHNLDRVLFNPGVYHMQDPRSRVFNFDPYLTSIMPVDEFDFDALKRYITSSKDVKLRQLSATHGMKYCGSTSSMTSLLAHFHFLLSAWRRPTFGSLSRSIDPESLNFTALSRGPAAAFARFNDGVYAIDADKEYDTENILSMLGRSMEKLLTLPKEEFEKYRRTGSHQLSEEERNAGEAYHYTTLGDFMMRSQLDAHDPRLPGSGMFDLKTRAVVSIRMDVGGYEKGIGYEIRKRFGQWESFEREYYDMIRSAFLKYSLQVRMGRMDGIFVAFHNTQRIFGFQYISLAEMDQALHGTTDQRLGDSEFKASVALLNDLLDKATQRFPGRSLRLHVETRPTKVPLTYFFVEPVTDEEIKNIQEAGKSSVEQLEREIRDYRDKDGEAESVQAEANAPTEQQQVDDPKQRPDDSALQDARNDAAWKSLMAKVDETVENESLGLGSVREAVQDALEQSGLLQVKTELEVEQYLDAMVASLTAHSLKIKELRDKSDNASDTFGLTQQHSIDENDANAELLLTTNQSDDPEPAPATDESMQSASLKDLILKVTEGIDGKTQNLGTFQRIFADLVTRSKKADTENSVEKLGELQNDDSTLDENERPLVDEDVTDDSTVSSEEAEQPLRELLGIYVTIRNKVNDEYVERPTGRERDFDWAIQYTITELPDERAQKIYEKIKKRRRTVLETDPSSRAADWHMMFRGNLPLITKRGEKYREERTQQEAGSPVYVAWDREPLSMGDANALAKETSQFE